MKFKHAIAAIILMSSFATPVAAGPPEDAFAAYSRGDYATALRLYQPLADKGSPTAQTNLGAMYVNGEGVARDYAEAVKWFRLAADQGLASAQRNLGVIYASGVQGVPRDYVLAYKWLSLSAAQGNKEAVKDRENFEDFMTPAQIAEAKTLAAAQITNKKADVNQPAPRYNVEDYCKKIADFGGSYSATLNNACIRQEQDAYDALNRNWGSYPSQVLAHCDRIATVGGDGSYTLLQACIKQEMQARSNPPNFRP